ncbi:MAG: hypothetical protein PVF13_02770, partial [Chromatiales bacterium]
KHLAIKKHEPATHAGSCFFVPSGETGTKARSAWASYTSYFANIPDITSKNINLVYFLSCRVKHSG